jgi:hypothetical protein
MKKIFFLFLFSLLFAFFSAQVSAFVKMTDREFAQLSDADALLIRQYRQGMIDIIDYMKKRPDLFDAASGDGKMSLNREQRLSVWNIWQSFLDHILAMDSLGSIYSQYYKEFDDERKKFAFRVSFAAFLAQYRYAMDFINIIEQNPDLHVILNEAVPEIGLPPETYSRLKFRFLNVIRGAEFARLHVVYSFYGKDRDSVLFNGISDDIAAIWDAGKWRGPIQTAQNGIQILQDTAFTAWFPVQKGVSNLMSEIRVRRGDDFLISQKQIKNMIPELAPGDILLQRREWCMTNIGLPGFWTHAALYVGTADERVKYFHDSHRTKAWVKSMGNQYDSLEELLAMTFPKTYLSSIKTDSEGHYHRVIEAIGEGVVFTTLEHSADADSMVVLRPVVSKETKAMAIFRAFNFSGRPYDFNFDFLTDSALVCSELVYKAYLPAGQEEGLFLPLSDMLGRKVLSPNNIARLFDEEYDRAPQLDFVLFFDGNEKKEKAVQEDVSAFRKSWERPKWHIVIKDTVLDASCVEQDE